MARFRRITEQTSQSDDTHRWLVSYADYMTLMFALFVVLYAFAILKEKDYQLISDTLGQVFQPKSKGETEQQIGVVGEGILLERKSTEVIEQDGNSIVAKERGPELVDGYDEITNIKEKALGHPLDSLQDSLKSAISEQVETGQAELILDDDWLIIKLNSSLLFSSGSAHLTSNAERILMRLEPILGATTNYVRVRGYTDNQPINNELFKSNWQLSAARATSVLELLEAIGIEPQRMVLEGYGQYAPSQSNNTEAGRNANRKVVIAISKYAWLKPKMNDDESTQTAKPVSTKTGDDEIKVIQLPHGGIRVTTREEEN